MSSNLAFVPPTFVYRTSKEYPPKSGITTALEVPIHDLVHPPTPARQTRSGARSSASTRGPTTLGVLVTAACQNRLLVPETGDVPNLTPLPSPLDSLDDPFSTDSAASASTALSRPVPPYALIDLIVSADNGQFRSSVPVHRHQLNQSQSCLVAVTVDVPGRSGEIRLCAETVSRLHFDKFTERKEHLHLLLKEDWIDQRAYLETLETGVLEFLRDGASCAVAAWEIDLQKLFHSVVAIDIQVERVNSRTYSNTHPTQGWADDGCQDLLNHTPTAGVFINPFRLQNLALALCDRALTRCRARKSGGDRVSDVLSPPIIQIQDLDNEEAIAVLNLVSMKNYMIYMYEYFTRLLGSEEAQEAFNRRGQDEARGWNQLVQGGDMSARILYAIEVLNNLQDVENSGNLFFN